MCDLKCLSKNNIVNSKVYALKIKQAILDGSQVLAYSLVFSHLTFIPYVHAGPGGSSVHGGADFATVNTIGAITNINQLRSSVVIDWQSYNLNANEVVNYIQPGTSSIALNRIFGDSASQIHGQINANGNVILVNTNGLFFSPTSSINVGGLIASGLDIDPVDFMNGDYIFNEVLGTDGTVINSGIINASLGGNVALLGKQVINDGVISAQLGSVNLAAGKAAVLTFDNQGLLGVKITKEILQDELGIDPAVINSGDINAEGGRVLLTASVSQDVFSQAVNSGDIQQATSVVMNEDGSFTLGGGADVLNSGAINVSSDTHSVEAGKVVLLGENITHSGEINANSATGDGGEIELHANNTTLIVENSVTSAVSDQANGGLIKVLGNRVGILDQSLINASGDNGGGEILIGGDYQGKNSSIRNSNYTYVDKDSRIINDAISNGDGGKTILWSDTDTIFLGAISVQGGEFSGNGGFVETSGKENLIYRGITDRSALYGSAGTLLLDPRDITISNGTADNAQLDDQTINFGDGAANEDFTVSTAKIVTELANGNVILQANQDITVSNSITAGSTNTNNLTLQAGDSLTVNASVDLRGGDINLTSGSAGCVAGATCVASGEKSLIINGTLDTTGAITLMSADDITIQQDIGNTRQASSVTMRAGDNISIETSDSITTNGSVSLIASDATLASSTITVAANGAVTGDINIRGQITTNNGAFTARTEGADGGYIDNDYANGSISTGTGDVTFSATGNNGGNNYGLWLGGVTTTTGDLFLTSTNGHIFQDTDLVTNKLEIGGTSTINSAASNIILTNATNNFTGTVGLTAATASIRDTNEIQIGNSAISGTGAITLDIVAGGNITQTAATTIANSGVNAVTRLTAAGNAITLDQATNNFNQVEITDAASATLRDVGAIQLNDITLTGTSSNNFSVTAGGDIIQGTGNIENNGTGAVSSFTALGQVVNLAESTNDFTQVNVSAATATIADIDSIVIGNSTLTGTATTSFQVTANTNGDITQASGSSIVNSGANAITNFSAIGNSITVNEAPNNFNQFAATADSVNVRDTNSIVLHNLAITGSSATTLTVTSGGSVNQLATTTIDNSGTDAITDITATSGFVTLTQAGNDFTQINLNTLLASIQDTNSIRLGDITTTFANATSLQVTALNNGDITQAAGTTISNNSVGSITNLVATANSINVGEATNDFNRLRMTAESSVVRDINAIELNTISLSGAAGTNLTVTAGNNITQTTGTVITNAGAGAISSFSAAGNAITLDNANDFTSVGVTANSASFTDINSVVLDDSVISGTNATTLDVTATGAVTQNSGTSIDNNGVGAITNIDAAGQNVTLSNAANDFTTVTAVNAVNLDLEDANSINLGAMSVTGTLDVVANGAGNITQSGPLVVTGVTTLTATGDDITLDNVSNNFSTVAVTDADIVNIFDLNSIILDTSFTTGQFNITANSGSITQANALDMNGTSSFTATSGAINLNDVTNDFTGAVSLNNSGINAVTVNDQNAIILGTSNTGSGTLTINADGITQNGAITQEVAAGLTTFNAGNGIIDLTQANDFTGSVSLNNTGASTAIRDTNNLTLTTSVLGTGSLSVNAVGISQQGGPITQQAGAGNVVLNANGGGISLTYFEFVSGNTYTNVNDFTGAVSLLNSSANSVAIYDNNSIDIGFTDVAGALQVLAFNGGNITQSDSISVAGSSSFFVDAGQSIELNNAANNFQQGVSFIPRGGSQLLDVSIANSGTLSLGNINVSNDLIVSAAGIADTGVLSVGGTAWFDAGVNSIVLDSANSDFNNVVFNNASSVSIVDLDDINVGTTDATPGGVFTTTNSTITGGFSITATGGITDTDTSILTVGGVSTLNSGTNNIVLDASTNDFSIVNVTNAQDVTLVDANSIDLLSTAINGNLDVTATTGDVLNTSGALNVTGTSNFVAADNSSVLLTNAGNRLNGAISVSSIGPGDLLDATITNSVLTDILSLNVLNDLIINSTNGLTQSGLITVGNNATINTGAQNIDLNLANNFNTLNITNAGNATLNNGANALLVNGVSASGAVNLSSNGMTIAGTVTGAAGTNLDSTTGVMQINADVQTSAGTLQISGSQVNLDASLISTNSNTSVNSSQGITMIANSDITATNGNIQLAAITNVDLTSLVATNGSAAVSTTTGSIIDANADQLNFTATDVVMTAATGIGEGNSIETQTSSLNVINNISGKVEIDNTGIVNILGLKNLGSLGDITITNDDDYLLNPGSIDAGYNTGELLMTTVTGSYLGQGPQPPFTNADITARAGTFFGFGGTFGTTQRPLVLNIRDSALIQTRASLNPQFAEPRPVVTDESLLQFSGLDTLSAISGEQLVEVETLAEVDQAIFTDLQNFSMEEISIRMPRDQLFEDELEEYDRAK